MTVICDACATENRDRAMFCRGCANKLPAFTPTGTSALETLGVRSSKYAARRVSDRPLSAAATFFEPESVRRWITALVLFTGIVLALVAWFAFRGDDAAVSTAPDVPASSSPSPALASSATRLPPEISLAPNETLEESARSRTSSAEGSPAPASIASATAAGAVAAAPAASVVPPSGSAQASSSVATVIAPAVAQPEPQSAATGSTPAVSPVTSPQRAPVPAPAPSRRTAANPSGGRAADPRVGCDHLFFAFAARCEANHCQQAAYARHPRCDIVREQRRLDDARRNSLPGN